VPDLIAAVTIEQFMQPYAAILFAVGLVVVVAAAMLILAHAIGPRRRGPVKSAVYESGMPPVADARRRFNVRFYIVALLFLLFDVEVVVLWPWALAYYEAAVNAQTVAVAGEPAGKGFLLGGAGIFLSLLVLGLVYEWRKGVFRWS
jgi:NADH-quinone oxidoreductase subunit A